METNEYEPASNEFVHAISKENVFYKLLKNLEEKEEFVVQYNDWECDSEQNLKEENCVTDDDNNDDDDDDDDDVGEDHDSDDDSDDDGDDDGDDDDIIIQPFQSLNRK